MLEIVSTMKLVVGTASVQGFRVEVGFEDAHRLRDRSRDPDQRILRGESTQVTGEFFPGFSRDRLRLHEVAARLGEERRTRAERARQRGQHALTDLFETVCVRR